MNPTTDRFTVRAVVLGLIVVGLSIVVSLVVILLTVDLSSEQTTQVVTTLQGFGGVAIGAVAGLLAHTASQEPAGPPADGAPIGLPVVGGQIDVAPMPEPAPDEL